MKTGVYRVTNTRTNKSYVGSTSVSFDQRWRQHRDSLRRGDHPNRYLQNAWNKDGEGMFTFVLLEPCPSEDCLAREQFWIDRMGVTTRAKGYNLRPTASSNLGLQWSLESKRRISAAQKGRVVSEETKKRMSESQRARWAKEGERDRQGSRMKKTHNNHDPLTRARRSATMKKKWEDTNHREIMLERLHSHRGCPEWRKGYSQVLREAWGDPVKRAARLEKLRATRAAKRNG
jgi:group I intron endonuclease